VNIRWLINIFSEEIHAESAKFTEGAKGMLNYKTASRTPRSLRLREVKFGVNYNVTSANDGVRIK